MRRALELAREHALDLLQLLHELLVDVQAPGGVEQDHLVAEHERRLERLEGHRGGVRALLLAHDLHGAPLGPDRELVGGAAR